MKLITVALDKDDEICLYDLEQTLNIKIQDRGKFYNELFMFAVQECRRSADPDLVR